MNGRGDELFVKIGGASSKEMKGKASEVIHFSI